MGFGGGWEDGRCGRRLGSPSSPASRTTPTTSWSSTAERPRIAAFGPIIRLFGPGAQKKCPYSVRRVVVWDELNQHEIVLLTNHLEFGATTIAAICRDR